MRIPNVRAMTWQEVDREIADGKNAIAVWGWGSIEQHGPRMLLETDAMIAEHFADLLAAEGLIKFPTVPIGMARHHEAFPGTTSLSQEAAYGVAASVLRSIYRTGIRKLVALMGHGGNVAPFHAALHGLGKELDGLKVIEPLDALFYTKDGELGQLMASFGESISHAGAAECSLLYAMLHRQGRWAEVDRLRVIPIEDAMVTHGVHGQGTKGGDPAEFRRMFPFGSKGDQRKADLNRGQRMLELMEEELHRQANEFDDAG